MSASFVVKGRKGGMAWALALFLMLGGLPAAWAASSVYPAASRQDPLGDLGGAARATALGMAYVGVADDVSALFWNPAGLSSLTRAEVTASHRSWISDSFQDSVVVGAPMGDAGGLALSFHYVDYGSFEGRDLGGFPAAPYSAQQGKVGAGWGRKVLGDLAVGVALNGVMQNLAGQTEFLVGGDLGLLLRTQDGWGVGVSVENLGLGEKSSELASSLRLGASKKWKDAKGTSLLAALGGAFQWEGYAALQVGVEGSYESLFFLRAGYDLQLQNTGLTGLQGLTAGAGLFLEPLRLDYAFVPYGDLGSTHLLTLGYSFGPGGTKPAPSIASTVPDPMPALLPLPEMPPVAPATVFVPQPAAPIDPAPQVQPQALPAEDPGQEKKVLTMEFDVPTAPGLEGAKTLAREGRLREAVTALKDILQKDPSDAAAWRELGNIYFRAGQKAYAIHCYEKALALRPDQALSDWLERYKTR